MEYNLTKANIFLKNVFTFYIKLIDENELKLSEEDLILLEQRFFFQIIEHINNTKNRYTWPVSDKYVDPLFYYEKINKKMARTPKGILRKLLVIWFKEVNWIDFIEIFLRILDLPFDNLIKNSIIDFHKRYKINTFYIPKNIKLSYDLIDYKKI